MSLSLTTGPGIKPRGWWSRHITEGVTPELILAFDESQYYNNGGNKSLSDLVTSARSDTKSAWNANGDIVTIAAETPVQAYNPVTLANEAWLLRTILTGLILTLSVLMVRGG